LYRLVPSVIESYPYTLLKPVLPSQSNTFKKLETVKTIQRNAVTPMINKKMVATLQQIREQEKTNGAATAPEITTYNHRSSKYPALNKMCRLELIKEQDAPTTRKIKKTYRTTSFGRKLLQKTRKAEIKL